MLPTEGESSTQTQQIPKLYPSGFTGLGSGLGLGLCSRYNQGIFIQQHMKHNLSYSKNTRKKEHTLKKSLADSSLNYVLRGIFNAVMRENKISSVVY